MNHLLINSNRILLYLDEIGTLFNNKLLNKIWEILMSI
jgi:hypothetical protein